MHVRDEADRAAREVVERLLREIEPGAFAPHHHHGEGLEERGEPHPLAAVRAANLLLCALRRHLGVAALAARSKGESWSCVAEALDLRNEGEPDAQAAFLTVVAVTAAAEKWSRPPTVAWPCLSCLSAVRDRGPEAGSPAEREAGHAPTCTRPSSEWVPDGREADR